MVPPDTPIEIPPEPAKISDEAFVVWVDAWVVLPVAKIVIC